MKKQLLAITAALIGAGAIAHADLQFNAGGLYAAGEEEDSFGFELGAGFYFEHSTSAMSSSLSLAYLGISSIDTDEKDVNMSAGYDVVALDYRLAFPLIQERVLEIYIEGLAGFANTDVSASIDDLDLNADDWGFAWGVGAGLQWNITRNVGLNLGYTYLGLDEASEQGVALGEDSLNLVRLNAVVRF